MLVFFFYVMGLISFWFNQSWAQSDLSVMPLFMVIYDSRIKPVNLTPCQECSSLSQEIVLDLDSYQGGFKVTKSQILMGTAGVQGSFHFNNLVGLMGPLEFEIGLSPSLGSTMISIYTVDQQKDISQKRKVPKSMESLSSWKRGDSISYSVTGGLALSASIGGMLFNQGATVAIEGSWDLFIIKTGPTQIALTLNQTNYLRGSVLTRAAIMSLSFSQSAGIGQGLGFEIDLSDPMALLAYEDFLAGNLIPIQQMAQDKTNPHVIETSRFLMANQEKTSGVSFGLPYMSSKTSTEKTMEYQFEDKMGNGQKVESYYSIYTKKRKNNFLLKHETESLSFYGGIATVFDKMLRPLKNDVKMNFQWLFDKDQTSERNIFQAMSWLENATGLDFPAIKIRGNQKSKLGFVTITYELDASQSFYQHLIKRSQSGSLSQQTQKIINEIKDYFEHGDQYLLCREGESLFLCEGRLIQEVRRSIDQMDRALKDMHHFEKTNPKKFAKALSKVGQALWRVPFVFRSFHSKAIDCGAKTIFKVGGKRLTAFVDERQHPLRPYLCQ